MYKVEKLANPENFKGIYSNDLARILIEQMQLKNYLGSLKYMYFTNEYGKRSIFEMPVWSILLTHGVLNLLAVFFFSCE